MERNKLYKAIYGLAKELSIDKDELYSILWRETKKSSMKLCTDAELKCVVDYLKLYKNTNALQNKSSSTAQRKKIVALAYSLGWDKTSCGQYQKGLMDKRLNGLCEKQYGISDFRWLNKEKAWAFIETLKKIKAKQDADAENQEHDKNMAIAAT